MACTMAKQGAQSLLPTTDIAPAQMIIKIRSTCLFIERSHSYTNQIVESIYYFVWPVPDNGCDNKYIAYLMCEKRRVCSLSSSCETTCQPCQREQICCLLVTDTAHTAYNHRSHRMNSLVIPPVAYKHCMVAPDVSCHQPF